MLSVRMRSPSIVPGFDVDVYLVLDDFGKLGRAYREVDEEHSDRETVIRNLTEGQYSNPVRIVCFNTSEGWSRDVTEDIAREIQDRAASKGEGLTFDDLPDDTIAKSLDARMVCKKCGMVGGDVRPNWP
jgi:hypothetical protein